MSFIITADVEAGKYKILADAKYINQVQIYSTEFKGWMFNITGRAEKPFIHSVRFIGCTIIAEDLSAFRECYFDDDCEMIVKNMPVVNGCESTGNNRAIKPNIVLCDCIGGCLESDDFLQNNKQKLPKGVKCQIKNNS